jgi:hypothetical protein
MQLIKIHSESKGENLTFMQTASNAEEFKHLNVIIFEKYI